ncbi:hypothetical protein GCM10027199_80470 [Amycolatopsis magusensis]
MSHPSPTANLSTNTHTQGQDYRAPLRASSSSPTSRTARVNDNRLQHSHDSLARGLLTPTPRPPTG